MRKGGEGKEELKGNEAGEDKEREVREKEEERKVGKA